MLDFGFNKILLNFVDTIVVTIISIVIAMVVFMAFGIFIGLYIYQRKGYVITAITHHIMKALCAYANYVFLLV